MATRVESIFLEGPRKIGLRESELPPLGPSDVRIKDPL